MKCLCPVTVVAVAFSLFPASRLFAGESHVKVSLISDVSAIHTPKPFTVGVLLEIDPGWHVYWINPGEGGLATAVKFTGPKGFTITAQPFPVPRRIQQGTNEQVFGYEDAVLITAQVTRPENLMVGETVEFIANVSWLVCKAECMPGKASAKLSLKVDDHAGPANVATFERLATTVAPAPEESPDVAEVKASIDPATHLATLTVHWKNAISGVEVFPGASDAPVKDIQIGKMENSATPITLKIEPATGAASSDRLPVLVAYHDAAGRARGFETTVPLK